MLQRAPETTYRKLQELRKNLQRAGKAAVAFSGGVDSTFLLKTAHDVLGEKVVAISAVLYSTPSEDFRRAQEFCREEGIVHLLCPIDELQIPGFRENPPDRCYRCKKEIFTSIRELAQQQGAEIVMEGSNLDDLGDYRPGLRALAELSIASPLKEAQLTKEEIRLLSRDLGLSAWNLPSCACLSSRIPYGEEITREKLSMADRAENYLRSRGLSQIRVRIYGRLAKIEALPGEMALFLSQEDRQEIVRRLKEIGFLSVCLDLEGFRSGSMNEVLQKENGEQAAVCGKEQADTSVLKK